MIGFNKVVTSTVRTLSTADMECGNLSKNNFLAWTRREITKEEFEKENAYLALNYGLDEMSWQNADNVQMPKDLREFYDLDKRNRKAEDGFWQRRDISKYVKKISEIYANNISNITWLLTLRERFAKLGDKTAIEKVNKPLYSFPVEMRKLYG